MAMLALVALTFASCQKENVQDPSSQEADVTFTLSSPAMQTKAFADGNTVNTVHVHVYKVDASGNLSYIAPTTGSPTKEVTMTGGSATYSARLVTGQKYTFVFWADYQADGYTSPYTYDAVNQTISVNYNAACNDEKRDAFYAVIPNVTITGAYSQSVTLKRPFAQVNFGVTTADYDAAVAAGVTVNGAAVKCTKAANAINLLNGTTSGEVDATFATATLPSETLTAANTSYKYVAMNYVLVGKDAKTLSDITLTLEATGAASATPEYTHTFHNIPLQGNYRTNIVGDLFTSPASINITVDSDFEGDNNKFIPNVSSIQAANEALANGYTNIYISNITASEAATTNLKMPATPESINISIESIESSANLTINQPTTGSNPASVAVTIPPTASVNQLTINLPQSHVEINGASYTSINATTSNNTLVIGENVTVGTLTVNQGAAIIKGAVTNVIRGPEHTGNIEWHVKSAAEFKEAVKVANMVILEQKIELESSAIITNGAVITIDLNGYDITAPSKVLNIANAKVDFVGSGKIYETEDDQFGALLLSGSNEDIANYTVVNIGEQVVLAGWSGIFVAKDIAGGYKNYGIVVNCKGTLQNPGMESHNKPGNGVYINGSNKNTNGNVPKFNFEGSTFSSKGVGIYAAGYAEWKLDNCNITGAETAIEIRAGKMTIDGGNYTSIQNPLEVEPNGNGTTTSGAALGISQHTTNLPIDVIVNGGTFTGAYAIWEKDVQDETARDQIKLTVNNGTFNGAIYSQNNPNAIIKGTYSDPSVLHYLAEGADVKIEMTADNEITSEVSVSQKAEINLNDHKLKVSAYFTTIGSGSLAISNGSIECECVDPSVNNPQIRSYGSSHMSFDDVVMTSNTSAVYVGDECNFSIKNSTIKAKFFGISTNARYSNQNPTINVDKCTITSNDPILVNIPCSLTVKNSNLNGTMHGAVVRGGTATFTDCHIFLKYPNDDAYDMAHYFDNRKWGQGNMVNLAAMTIGNKTSTAYQYPTNVSLVNTEVKVEGDYANYFPSLYAYANAGEGLGVTLTYDENCTFTGGTGMSYGSTNIVVNGTAVNAE